MLDRILPRRIDNTYRGHPFAVWLFLPVVLFGRTAAERRASITTRIR